MKTFIIYETVPVRQLRTITIQAENEEEAVEKYLSGNADCDIDMEEDIDWEGAEIVEVEEEKE